MALILAVAFSPFAGCSEDKDKDEKADRVDPGSADGQPQAKIPDGFNVLTPNYLGLKQQAEDSTQYSNEFLEEQCEGRNPGDFFSFRSKYSEYDDLHFCLGPFTRPENDNRIKVCIDCRSKIDVQNLYVGIVTDKGKNGVADISVITITETADFVRPDCDASDFNDDALRASWGGSVVSKSILEQMLSLQTDDGVCSDVRLADYRQLQSVTMEDWNDRKAEFTLTPVTLEGR
jgi:hypothetical protein